MESFIGKWAHDLSDAERTYLRRGLKRDRHGIACFYTMIKVYKNPHTFHPIVATCGTALSILSSWIDYKLRQLLPFVDTCIKDSSDFRSRIRKLGKLPKKSRSATTYHQISMWI